MKSLSQLNGKERRRHLKFLRQIIDGKRSPIFVRREFEFRMAQRLHQAGMITAAISKYNLFRRTNRPFRELALFSSKQEASKMYSKSILPIGTKNE